MKIPKPFYTYEIAVFLMISTLVISCSQSQDAAPALSPEQIQTQAVATFSAGLTQTADALPTQTQLPSPTASPTSTETAAPTQTPQATAVRYLPTSSCYALSFVKDVTIPDNTKLKPGEEFTKTWRIKNSGTCEWDKGFGFSFISGNAMGGADYTLPKAVSSGAELEISIQMKAPKTEGFYTGNWRMTDDSGVVFGDNVYVLIEVVTPTATKTQTPPSPTATTAPAPTDTAVPE